ncbi:MAG: sensor histidine kinase [Halarsenatibacteraceae bacterium]
MAELDSLGNNLEDILAKTVSFIEDSTQDVFAIAESSREELENIKNELLLIQQEIDEVIYKLDNKEKENKEARQRLMEVSQQFDRYSEREIKKVYELAEDTSVEIAVLREKEEQLQQRRRELEERYKKMEKTNTKAESLVSRMGVVKDFLDGELVDINDQFDDLRDREQLAFKIIQAQEEERKRVAREIHDGPAQSMANLVLRTEVVQQILKEDKEQAINELDDLKDIVRSSVKDIRKIIYDLRPMSLDDLGLVPTLRKYIDDFTTETGIMVELMIRGEERSLPPSFEITIFRLVQEALTNMRKHSDANSGRVQIEYTRNDIKILIIDDGKGFNQDDDFENSYGIISMKERCKLLQGDFKISSEPGKGTRISIVLPLDIERKG